MKKLMLGTLLGVFLGVGNLDAQKIWTERDASAPNLVNIANFTPIVELLDPTVVHIATFSSQQQPNARRRSPRQGPIDPFSDPEEFFERFFGNPMGPKSAPSPRRTMGSGFIISKDGYILTNNHVVEGAEKVEVMVLAKDRNALSGNKFVAEIVGRDPATDVALLKVKTDVELPVAPLGNSERIRKGDWVLALGNPFGLDHSVSAGIVSALGREISPNENRRFDDFIQTDAAINFGNSGGPLVNLRGEVIGINTAITAQGSGIGFAVPINVAKDILEQLKEKGKVVRGYLGVMIQDVTEDLKAAMNLPSTKGVVVNDIVADGPAAKSGLERGDVILKINGKTMDNAKTLQRTVAQVTPGKSIDLEVFRKGKTVKLSLKVGSLNAGEAQETQDKDESFDRLGLMVGPVPDGSGVQIVDIQPGSAADSAEMAPGDIVRKIANKEITSVEQYHKVVKGLKSKQTVLLDLERRNIRLFFALRIP